MRGVIDFAVRLAWVWIPSLWCRPGWMTKTVWTPGSLSVRMGDLRGCMEDLHEMLTPKVPGTLHPNTCSWGASTMSQAPCLRMSGTDAGVTSTVFNFEWLDLKFKPSLLLISVKLFRVIDIFFLVEYMVNLHRTFEKKDKVFVGFKLDIY